MSELTDISEEVVRKWHLSFIHIFSENMYEVYVHPPSNETQIERVLAV